MANAATDLPGYLLKLKWAHAHLEQLNFKIVDWLNSDHQRSWMEPDGKRGDHFLFKASANRIPADPLSLIIGDTVQNLRNSLDYIAFHLASNFTKPLPDELASESQFPIVGDINRKGASGSGPAMFQAQSKCLAGIDPRAKAVIERLQPYYRGSSFKSHPLWKLRELSNIDKHRFHHLVTASSMGLKITIIKPDLPFADNLRVFAGIVTTETVIARFRLRPGADKEMNVTLEPDLFISLEQSPDEGIGGMLGGIYNYILTEVIPALEPFF
jgi:hypothetical protein